MVITPIARFASCFLHLLSPSSTVCCSVTPGLILFASSATNCDSVATVTSLPSVWRYVPLHIGSGPHAWGWAMPLHIGSDRLAGGGGMMQLLGRVCASQRALGSLASGCPGVPSRVGRRRRLRHWFRHHMGGWVDGRMGGWLAGRLAGWLARVCREVNARGRWACGFFVWTVSPKKSHSQAGPAPPRDVIKGVRRSLAD